MEMAIVFFLILIKSLLWVVGVPIFQAPDEQAHFTQLEYMVENHKLAVDSPKNLSLETATIEEILGTRRDGQGNNKYTYHPEFKTGPVVFPDLPRFWRTIYVDQESANYPPLYYILDAPLYLAAYDQNVFGRVMASRLLSVIFNLGLFVVAFKIGRTLWQDNFKSLVLGVVVTFQPMISFVAAGIHPDNLLNLLSSVMILITLYVLRGKVTEKNVLLLGVLAYLGVQTKQTAVFFLPAILAALIWKKFGWPSALAVLVLPAAAFVFRWPLPYMPYVGPESPLASLAFLDYLKFRLPKLAFEMWPWYWGVFKWLSVTLPPLWLKIITRIAVACAVGVATKFFRSKPEERRPIVFFLVANISFVAYLLLWDWRLMQSMGFSQGLQARYLFPNIVPQMALLLTGFWTIGRVLKIERASVVLSALLMIILNISTLIYVGTLY